MPGHVNDKLSKLSGQNARPPAPVDDCLGLLRLLYPSPERRVMDNGDEMFDLAAQGQSIFKELLAFRQCQYQVPVKTMLTQDCIFGF